ncbi:MAG: hypothetical protein RLZZ09_31 [Pseudomonadota bacterium]|jgi:hypothetical protein
MKTGWLGFEFSRTALGCLLLASGMALTSSKARAEDNIVTLDEVRCFIAAMAQPVSAASGENGAVPLSFAVSFHCTNLRAEPMAAFDPPALSLFDGSGREYPADVDATRLHATATKLDSRGGMTLAAGATFTSADVFLLPPVAPSQGPWQLQLKSPNRVIKLPLKLN